MACGYCIDIKSESYSMGDLNLMFENSERQKYPPIDNHHPYKPFITGVIRQDVQINNKRRRFLTYIPKHFPISGAGLFVYPDDGNTCEEFLETSGFKDLSEDLNFALIILESEAEGWSQERIQKEITYSEKVFRQSISRTWFSLNEATYYIMGFGKGAYVSTAFGLLNSSLFSCMLADGKYQLDVRLYKQLGKIKSDRDTARSKTQINMPAWLVSHETEYKKDDVFEGLKEAAYVSQKPVSDAFSVIFQPNAAGCFSDPDKTLITEVRYTSAEKAKVLSEIQLHKEMVSFALRFKRWLGIGNGDIRPARSYNDMRLIRKEAMIDGRLREWYIHIPSSYKEGEEKAYPLVLAIHGYSCTGALFAESTEWHEFGERRDFITLYVSAYPSNEYFNGRTVPLPTWNSIGMYSETDDIKYILDVLDDVQKSYRIDTERIYVTGHSNGSLMTQKIMSEIPLKFAAFAPQGAQFHLNLTGDGHTDIKEINDDGIIRPVWLMMGEHDIGFGADLSPGNPNDKFIEMMCRVNHLNRDKGQCLNNGKYTTYTYTDTERVPLLKFTAVKDLPHTYTPEMAQLSYDQFLCHFRRKRDGIIEYTD